MKAALAGAAFLALATTAELGWARRNGLAAPGCEGCHSASGASATLIADPASFLPGADVTFSLVIRGGTNATGGAFVTKPQSGALYALTGEGLTLTGEGLVHSAPKAAQGGSVTFRFGWRAPATPAGLNLEVFVLSANGDGRSTGDVAGNTTFRAVFGCAAKEFYYDGDADGFGSQDFQSVLGCDGAPPTNTSASVGDCNDSDSAVFPGAKELCNAKDDDCDTQVDEETSPTELYPDEDGDGFYARNPVGPALIGCVPLRGYAAQGGDCSPKDPLVFPGATETCNAIDDDCDGRVDHRLRPQCGIGFCRRESVTCEPENCTPGAPSPEQCNLLDDDCDGDVDEGAACPAGLTCVVGKCGAGGAVSSGGTGGSVTSAGGSLNGGTGGASGTQGGSAGRGGLAAAGATGSSGSSGAGAPERGGSSSAAGAGGSSPPTGKNPSSGGCTSARVRSNTSGSARNTLGALLLIAVAARRRWRRAPKS